MAGYGYLANVSNGSDDNNNNKKKKNNIANCRIVKLCWMPPSGLPYIYIGTNKKSRKYNDLLNYNNNAVLTIGDEPGAGCVSLKGKISLLKDENLTKEMFPQDWKIFFQKGRSEKDFVVLILNIQTIEFASVRLGYNSISNQDWKPYIITRKGDISDPQNIQWQIGDDD